MALFPDPAGPWSQMILWLGSGTVREMKRSCNMSTLVSGRHVSRYAISISAGSSLALSIARTVIHEVALPSPHERMRIIPCSFASQEARADTNLDDLSPDPSAVSSWLRAVDRFDTMSCVSKIGCGANRSKGISCQTLGLHRMKYHDSPMSYVYC